MADTVFRDANGVQWLIVQAGGKFFGTPDPSSARQYDPQPPDTSIVTAEGAAAGLITKYAVSHSADVTLLVRESGGGGVLLAFVLLLLVMADNRR